MAIKIPASLEECFVWMKDGPSEETQREFKEMPEDKAVALSHHSYGRWIRNNWGLWAKDGPLYKLMTELGLDHPDDMSGLIITSFHRHLNGKSLDVEGQVKKYKDYWADLRKEEEEETEESDGD
jgi:hypothetical protein